MPILPGFSLPGRKRDNPKKSKQNLVSGSQCHPRKLELPVTKFKFAAIFPGQSATRLILSQLESPQALLAGAACAALGELGRSGPLPLKDDDGDDEMETDDSEDHKVAELTLVCLVDDFHRN